MLKRILIISLSFMFFNGCIKDNRDEKIEIEDTSIITKIFLSDRVGNTITIHKDDENWIINNKYQAKEEAVNMLLSTANKIRLKKPASKSSFENVIKFMATTGVSVEFFTDEEMIKSYTIGSNTADHLGTYMLLKGSKKPCVMHIPGFNGFLSPRYGIQGNVIDIMNWRSNQVFNLLFEEIKYIRYIDYITAENSYTLKTDPFKLENSQGENVAFKKKNLLKLLSSFENLNCETFKSEKSDKISSSMQIKELIVNNDTLRVYKISELAGKTQKENFTVDRKYATLNDGELMLIQNYVFNKVLINISELTN